MTTDDDYPFNLQDKLDIQDKLVKEKGQVGGQSCKELGICWRAEVRQFQMRMVNWRDTAVSPNDSIGPWQVVW